MEYTSKGSNIVEFDHEGYHVIAERAKGVITIHTRVVVGPDVSRAMKEYATQCFDDLDGKPNEHSIQEPKSEYQNEKVGRQELHQPVDPDDPAGDPQPGDPTDPPRPVNEEKDPNAPPSESDATSRGEEDPESEEEFATNVALANAPKKRKNKRK